MLYSESGFSTMASVSLLVFDRSYSNTHGYELKHDTAKNLNASNSQNGEVIMLNDTELQHLRRCVELATEALIAGDEPFGSVPVAANGAVLIEDRNRMVTSGDRIRHPEFKIAL
jgi:hypothetical protein